MTTIINVRHAKTHLSRLLRQALEREEVIIAKAGRPIARLVPMTDRGPRRPGIAKGKVTDAFFEPLPHDELAAWSR